jgi:hypothetical protein
MAAGSSTPSLLDDVGADTAWAPQIGPQLGAIQCPIEDMFYGGERGGGKSDFLLGDWLNHSDRYGRHASGIVFRRTYDELTELVKRSKDIFGRLGASWRGRGSDPGNLWTMPNGSTLLMRYLDRDDDADHYQGHQYTWMGVDQVEAFQDPTPIDKLWGSLRSAYGIPCVRRMTGNPPAPQWLRSRYIDAAEWGKPFYYLPQPELRPDLKIRAIFIHARLEDNRLLMDNDPKYEQRLAAVGGEALFRAWRYGDWDATVGQVFKEFRRDLHITPSEFEVPPYWEWTAGLDWGFRAPACFLLGAAGPDSDLIMVDELYFTQVYADEAGYNVGLKVREWCSDQILIHGDEQMWYQSGAAQLTIAEEFQNGLWQAYGGRRDQAPILVESSHGRGSRLTKKQLTHHLLAWKAEQDGEVKPWNRPKGRFHPRCENLIRTLPMLQYSKKAGHLEDVDTDLEDHAYDTLGNILVARAPTAKRPARPEPGDRHPGMNRSGRSRKAYMQVAQAEFEESQDMYRARRPSYRMPETLVPLED